VEAKSNEITAMPQLLELLDLRQKIVTTDALGCQKEIAPVGCPPILGPGEMRLSDNHRLLRLYYPL